MLENIDVLIYFEHKVRELDACLLLKCQLEILGFSVKVLPVHRNRYLNVLKYRPKILILPYLFADDNDRLLVEFRRCYGDVLCLNMHHEQFYGDFTKSHFMPKNEVSRAVYHLSWGVNFAKDLMAYKVKAENIFIDGNPRTDNFYLALSNEIARFKSKYKHIIFIPSSFGFAFSTDEQIMRAGLDMTKFASQKSLSRKTVAVFFPIIRNLAKRFPEYQFVFRPHPYDSFQDYIDQFSSCLERPLEDNIKFIREGNVYEWIKISDLTIGWLTTVNVEASAFNKNNIVFHPVPVPENNTMSFISLYDKVYTKEEELVSIIENISTFRDENSKLKTFLKSSFGNSDGNVNKRLACFVKNILESNQITSSYRGRLLCVLFKSLVIDLVKNLLIVSKLIFVLKKSFNKIKEDLMSDDDINRYFNELKCRIAD